MEAPGAPAGRPVKRADLLWRRDMKLEPHNMMPPPGAENTNRWWNQQWNAAVAADPAVFAHYDALAKENAEALRQMKPPAEAGEEGAADAQAGGVPRASKRSRRKPLAEVPGFSVAQLGNRKVWFLTPTEDEPQPAWYSISRPLAWPSAPAPAEEAEAEGEEEAEDDPLVEVSFHLSAEQWEMLRAELPVADAWEVLLTYVHQQRGLSVFEMDVTEFLDQIGDEELGRAGVRELAASAALNPTLQRLALRGFPEDMSEDLRAAAYKDGGLVQLTPAEADWAEMEP